MMALSGVRSSWLIFARNSDLRCRPPRPRFLEVILFRKSRQLLRLDLQRMSRLHQVGDARGQSTLGKQQASSWRLSAVMSAPTET